MKAEEFNEEHGRVVFKYLMTLTSDRNLAEELTQETFYQAIKSINRFDGSCKVTTWLCAIAKNQYYTYLRKNPAMEDIDMVSGELDSAFMSASPETKIIESEDKVKLLKTLHNCPEPYREIMYLRVFGNLSFKEIGDVFGKNENWARVSFYRAKERLRKEIESDEQK